jgi:hypothetical protein
LSMFIKHIGLYIIFFFVASMLSFGMNIILAS